MKTNLDPPSLMVYVVILRVVPEEELERIERECISTVIVNSFHGGEAKKEHSPADPQARDLVCHSGANRIHEETFDRMIVESAERVGNV